MDNRRILVTGTRKLTDADYGDVACQLGFYAKVGDILIHGDCEFGGFDQLAARYWYSNGIGSIESYGARKGGQFGNDAGRYKRRNQYMVNLKPDLCLAWADSWSSGTGQCARMARRAGIPVVDLGVDTLLK